MDVPDNPEPATLSASPSAKPRISYACEACRVAKVKCQPSGTESICRRCVTSKRECVFKTGPRTRRRRSKLHPAATRKTPPPSAPSKTFTIDVPMAADDGVAAEPSETLNALRDCHESVFANLVPEDRLREDDDGRDAWSARPPSSVGGSRAFSTPTPPSGARSVRGFSSIQPQFNLGSATALLASFQESMLPHFPVTSLPADADVPTLARERPFVLLAILAAASGSKSLQGHNLYDEEFRKVLGLKFVSGGERSLELLVGLLIYCAWYPFHLRPKNKQALQYVRMASDIVRDLDLDSPVDDEHLLEMRASEQRMAGLRAYLACYYVCSSFSSTWQKNNNLPYQQWTATCCDILMESQDAEEEGPVQTLVWLVRLGHIVEETLSLTKRQGQVRPEEQQVLLMVRGLEAQLQEWQAQIPVELLSQTPLRTATLFAEIVLLGYSLLKFPYSHGNKRPRSLSESYADPSRLLSCVNVLSVWYRHIAALPTSEFAHFTSVGWGAFVVAIIVGLRLSFPMPSECPGWDHAAARRTLDLGPFLEAFSDAEAAAGGTGRSTDVLAASKVVVGVVRHKYERRLAALQRSAEAEAAAMSHADADKSLHKCPMFDGSLNEYLQSWDDTFRTTTGLAGQSVVASGVDAGAGSWNGTWSESPGAQPVVFHDLWATMTMGWTRDGIPNDVDFGGI